MLLWFTIFGRIMRCNIYPMPPELAEWLVKSRRGCPNAREYLDTQFVVRPLALVDSVSNSVSKEPVSSYEHLTEPSAYNVKKVV